MNIVSAGMTYLKVGREILSCSIIINIHVTVLIILASITQPVVPALAGYDWLIM